MLNLGRLLAMATVLVLAGCTTTPRRQSAASDPGALGALPTTILGDEAALAPPPSATPGVPGAAFAGTWIPLNRWSASQGWPVPVKTDAAQPTYTLDAPGGKFVFRLGSRSAVWNGLEVRLGHAPQLIDGQPYLHTLDLSKTVAPLLAPPPALHAGDKPTVVLDPGHGGTDSGTRSVSGIYHEKHYTLDWALRLAPLLREAGWQVILTRTRDEELSLSNRVAIAEKFKADLFISLHFNSAAPNQTESGLETYCLTPAGLPSSLTRGYDDDLTQIYPNNNYDLQNLFLAARVHRALVVATGGNDRGLRRARFLGVLRGQQRPAILVEGGYLSNPAEAQRVATAAHRQKLAEALAAALLGRPVTPAGADAAGSSTTNAAGK